MKHLGNVHKSSRKDNGKDRKAIFSAGKAVHLCFFSFIFRLTLFCFCLVIPFLLGWDIESERPMRDWGELLGPLWWPPYLRKPSAS